MTMLEQRFKDLEDRVAALESTIKMLTKTDAVSRTRIPSDRPSPDANFKPFGSRY